MHIMHHTFCEILGVVPRFGQTGMGYPHMGWYKTKTSTHTHTHPSKDF